MVSDGWPTARSQFPSPPKRARRRAETPQTTIFSPTTDAPPATVSQREVEGLYRRFRQLDRGRKGFLTCEELAAIPQLCINPLAR